MQTIQEFLDSIYSGYGIVTFRGGRLIRGRLKDVAETASVEVTDRQWLTDRLRSLGWLFSFERVDGADYLTCTVMDRPAVRRGWLHFVLFIATIFTTLIGGGDLGFTRFYIAMAAIVSGLLHAGQAVLAAGPRISADYLMSNGLGMVTMALREIGAIMYRGIPFSFTILAILGCHEMGHYIAARRHGMNVTLPFFIPVPLGIGTLGALIRIRSPLVHRRMVLDVGAAGPLAGAVVAIAALAVGISMSRIIPAQNAVGIALGDSVLTKGLVLLIRGPMPPGFDIAFNPVAFAGWIGLLVTAINLLPIGQLDGGHVAYALFGRFQRRLATMAFGMLITFGVIGILTGFQTGSWPYLLFAAFSRSFMRPAHPPALDAAVRLNAPRVAVGIVCILLLLAAFVPTPFI